MEHTGSGQAGELLEAMRKRAWDELNTVPFDRPFLLEYLPRMQVYDAVDVAAYCCKHFVNSEVICLLWLLPELWSEWCLADWARLFGRVAPRPRPKPMFMDGFGDIQFFVSELRLDPFPLLTATHPDDITNQIYVAEQLRMHAAVYADEAIRLREPNAEQKWCFQQIERKRRGYMTEDPRVIPSWKDSEGLRVNADQILKQMLDEADSGWQIERSTASGIPSAEVLGVTAYRIEADGALTELGQE